MNSAKQILWIISIVLLVVIGIFAVSGRIRVVTGGSMSPTYKPGDVLFLGLPPNQLEAGMIISYEYQKKNITHRVVAVQPDGSLIMKGDANEEFDPQPVFQNQVVGTPLLHVPYLGYLIRFIRQPAGFAIFILLPISVIIFYKLAETWHLMSSSK